MCNTNRRTVLKHGCLLAAGAALGTTGATPALAGVASSRSLRETLIGAWRLVSSVETDIKTGAIDCSLGDKPEGLIIYTPDGGRARVFRAGPGSRMGQHVRGILSRHDSAQLRRFSFATRRAHLAAARARRRVIFVSVIHCQE
jgi:hypothetical protein